MDRFRMLSGEEIVACGVTKLDAILPEIGVKDVIPNGSWLEQKQIQSALEARKHLLEVERIQKSGSLSHAKWCEDLMLAEVTRQVGGHWQFIGHSVRGQLYLKPEEALFLMEVNCLQLTYNDVIVSLQQAYSLLLRGKVSQLQYKVYASLSRIGYKVYRHEGKNMQEAEFPKKESQKEGKEEIKYVNEEDTETQRDTDNKMAVDGAISEESSSKEMACGEATTVKENLHKNNEKGETMEEGNEGMIKISEKMVLDTDIMENGEVATTTAQGNISLKKNCLDIINSTTIGRDINTKKLDSVDQSIKAVSEAVSGYKENISIPSEKLGYNDSEIQLDSTTKAEEVNIESISSMDKPLKEVSDTNSTEKSSDQASHIIRENITEIQTLTTNGVNNINTEYVDLINTSTKDISETNSVHSMEKNGVKMYESLGKHSSEIKLDHTNGEEINTETVNLIESVKNVSEPNTAKSLGSSGEIKYLDTHLHHKIKMLENRKLKPLNANNFERCFEKVPDVYQKQIVTINVPEEEFIPRNVFLNNVCYVLNLESIKRITKSSQSSPYNVNDEVNGDHVRRIRSAAASNTPVITQPPLIPNNTFNRPFQNVWRPNFNFFPQNFTFQRPFMPHNFFLRQRFFYPRPPPFVMYPRFNSFQQNEQKSVPNIKKRKRDNLKQTHLEAIKNLAVRLRQLVQSGNVQQQQNIESLQRLINTFNTKYNMRLRLTDTFEIDNNETVVETICLDEDEEPSQKKVKSDNNKYKENFNKLKQLSLKLKGLEAKEEVNSRHRRAFSNLIKKFNKSYDADVYINSNGEIIDRKMINLDSSSDSDCVIEEEPKVTGKKVKNPFNILQRLSQKNPNTNATTDECNNEPNKKYSAITTQSFDKNWLPSEDDFGRAEIIPKRLMHNYLIESKREELLYEFLHSQSHEFDNWVDLKIAFLSTFESLEVEDEVPENPENYFLVGPEDNIADYQSVLKKISIIKTNKDIQTESSLSIDFDVYNRNVQNFKKSNRPRPHFRVSCISETSSFPSGKDLVALHSKYDDDVTLVFAVVGVGSISYLQINSFEIASLDFQ